MVCDNARLAEAFVERYGPKAIRFYFWLLLAVGIAIVELIGASTLAIAGTIGARGMGAAVIFAAVITMIGGCEFFLARRIDGQRKVAVYRDGKNRLHWNPRWPHQCCEQEIGRSRSVLLFDFVTSFGHSVQTTSQAEWWISEVQVVDGQVKVRLTDRHECLLPPLPLEAALEMAHQQDVASLLGWLIADRDQLRKQAADTRRNLAEARALHHDTITFLQDVLTHLDGLNRPGKSGQFVIPFPKFQRRARRLLERAGAAPDPPNCLVGQSVPVSVGA